MVVEAKILCPWCEILFGLEIQISGTSYSLPPLAGQVVMYKHESRDFSKIFFKEGQLCLIVQAYQKPIKHLLFWFTFVLASLKGSWSVSPKHKKYKYPVSHNRAKYYSVSIMMAQHRYQYLWQLVCTTCAIWSSISCLFQLVTLLTVFRPQRIQLDCGGFGYWGVAWSFKKRYQAYIQDHSTVSSLHLRNYLLPFFDISEIQNVNAVKHIPRTNNIRFRKTNIKILWD